MSRRGADNANWRGGRRRGGDGGRYILVYAPDHPYAFQGVVLEHRLVMEEILGRYLDREEIVHHINGDTLDNRPTNLSVMTQAEHAVLHYRERHGHETFYVRPPAPLVGKVCDYCRVYFTVRGKKNATKRFCSFDCYMAYRREVGGALQRGAVA